MNSKSKITASDVIATLGESGACAFSVLLEIFDRTGGFLNPKEGTRERSPEQLTEMLRPYERRWHIPPDFDLDEFLDALVRGATFDRSCLLEAIPKVAESARVASITSRAKKAARSRNSENRAMKAEVFTWLDANMVLFKSMDKAAEAIAGKIAPIAFRTARQWVGEWKKLRSTGTP